MSIKRGKSFIELYDPKMKKENLDKLYQFFSQRLRIGHIFDENDLDIPSKKKNKLLERLSIIFKNQNNMIFPIFKHKIIQVLLEGEDEPYESYVQLKQYDRDNYKKIIDSEFLDQISNPKVMFTVNDYILLINDKVSMEFSDDMIKFLNKLK